MTGTRGGERILEALCEVFPSATLFCLLHVPGSVSRRIEAMPIRTSFIQRLPFAKRGYRYYLPLFPRAVERFDLCGFDLVISVSHCVAKGAIVPRPAISVCICLTPMRYVWDMRGDYFPPSRPLRRLAVTPFLWRLKRWDRQTAGRVDHYVAISRFVASRIERFYGRESTVIYPPVDISRFKVEPAGVSDYYLIVSAFAPYKRIDIAIEAFRRLGRRLVIVGKGQQEGELKRMAPRNVEFAGPLRDDEVAQLFSRCKAVVFCGVEDFGIVPVEAMASGRPVIAYAGGGVLESVEDGKTGVLFHSQTPQALVEAIERADKMSFDPALLRKRAERFDTSIFKRRISEFIAEKTSSVSAGR